jgi:hypothetical protein
MATRLLSTLCGLLAGNAAAQELLPPVRDLNGIRALGLGVSTVSMAGLSQGETPQSNPAWVGQEGKIKNKEILRGLWFPSATVGSNGTTQSLAKAYFSGEGSTQQRLENFLKASQNEQTPFGLFSMTPGFTVGPIHWGLFGRIRVEGYVWQPTGSGQDSAASASANEIPDILGGLSLVSPSALDGQTASQMDVRATVERGTSLSFAVPYKNTGVFLGVTVRPTWRSDFIGSVELDEPLVSASAKALRAKFNETRGYPVDVGAAVRLPKFALKPSFGLKIEDVADTRYKAASSAHQTVIQKSNISVGVAAWPLLRQSFAIQCTTAGHHLNDERLELAGKVGGGCELHLMGQAEPDLMSGAPVILRVGGHRDGLSYGLSWDMPFAIVEVASDVARVEGPIGYAARTDRRYFLRLSVNAGQP